MFWDKAQRSRWMVFSKRLISRKNSTPDIRAAFPLSQEAWSPDPSARKASSFCRIEGPNVPSSFFVLEASWEAIELSISWLKAKILR
jgi:hypothetical protein